eukprot:GGOE01054492.1.p1 GENE.GGOE01054492.1~~GGOE01054492.1.p1  ORF type:complete len:590 (+),score=124.50 GGOE01054492.1:605-2374(+)
MVTHCTSWLIVVSGLSNEGRLGPLKVKTYPATGSKGRPSSFPVRAITLSLYGIRKDPALTPVISKTVSHAFCCFPDASFTWLESLSHQLPGMPLSFSYVSMVFRRMTWALSRSIFFFAHTTCLLHRPCSKIVTSMPTWLHVPRFSVDWRGQIHNADDHLPALSPNRGAPKAGRRSRSLSPADASHDPSQSLRDSLQRMGQNHPKITQHRARQCQNRQCALCRANEALDIFDFKQAGGDDLAWQQIRANVSPTANPSEGRLLETNSSQSMKSTSSPLPHSPRNLTVRGRKNGRSTFDADRLRAQTEYRALQQAIKAETVRRRGKDGPHSEETRIGKLDFMLGVCRLQELHQKGTLLHFAGEDPSRVRRYVLSMLLLQVDVSQNLPPEAQRIRVQDLQEMMLKAYPSAPPTAVKELTLLCEQGRDMSVAAWDFLLLLHYVWNSLGRGQSLALFGFFGDSLHLQQMKRGESAMVQLLDLRMLLTLHERTLTDELQQTLETHLINKLDWGIQGQIPYRTFDKAVRAHPNLEALFHATGVAEIQEEWAAIRDAKVSHEGRQTPLPPQDSPPMLPLLESPTMRRGNRRSVTFAGL